MGGRFVRGCFMPVEGIPRYPVNIRLRQPQNRPGRCRKVKKTRKADRRIATSRSSSSRPSHCTGEQNKTVSQILVNLHTGHFH